MATKTLKLYDTSAAASKLGLSPVTIRSHVRRGVLVPSVSAGKTRLFTEADLTAFSASRRPAGRPPKG